MGPTRRLWKAMAAQRGWLVGAALLGFIAAASGVALMGTSGWLISRAAQMPPVLALSVAAVMVRAFALSRAVFRYAERLVGHDAAFRGLTDLRVEVYERLERLSPVGLARFRRGDLLARIVADVDTALDLPVRVVLPWAQAVLVSVATVAFLAWLVPGAGLALGLALLLGIAGVPWLVARIAAHAEERVAPLRGEVSANVVSDLDACADLLAFNAVPAAVERVRSLDVQLTAVARREAAGLGLGTGLSVLIQGLAVVGCLVAAIPAVTSGRLEPVWLAVAALLPLAAYDVVSPLPGAALAWQRVRASGRRLAEVLDSPLPVRDPQHPVAVPTGHPTLECRELSARWLPDGPNTLHGISLTLRPGERLAVVGPSGAGKSTLASVVLRFLDYSGSVSLEDVELSGIDGDDVRRDIGMLTQSAHVFDASVRENLRLGCRDATDEELLEAVHRVHLDAWLATLPDGLGSELGPHGPMSGGERQRLALARLLLARRRILVFDEPTEHLDPLTADALLADILETTKSCSVLLITHRLAGLESMDQILVLQEGRVTAAGSHDDLLRHGGWYAQRWWAESERTDLAALTADIAPGTALVRG